MKEERLGITQRFQVLKKAADPAAKAPVRILCVEDSEADFELLLFELRMARFAHTATRVEDEPGMRQALDEGAWDLVISDHSLPRFSSMEALRVLRERHPDVPFIIASGAIGEDAAVAALQSGADDYLLKHSMKRLVPAIENALAAAEARRERRRATEELRSGLGYLRALLRASPIAIISLDNENKITLINAAAERIFRIRREEAIGGPPPLTMPENQAIVTRLMAALEAGPVENMEETWHHRDGSASDLSFSAARLEGDAGVVLFISDLSEQKRAELVQRETETRFAAITANLPGVVFQMLARPTQEEFLMPYVSPGAVNLFGVTPDAFLARPGLFIELIDPADRNDLREAVLQSLRHQAPLEGQWRVSREGATRWIHLVATAREANGGNWLLDGIITDITAQKEAEQELMQSREELRELTAHAESVKEQERRLVARDIHDEIGSTLTGMKADLAWLKKRFAEDEEVMGKLTSMGGLVDGAVQTANRIIQALRPGILDYGIAPALEWQASDFSQRMDLEVAFETNAEDLALDIEQSTALFRVFQESLTNVAKYAKATRVETELFATPTSVTLEVRDNGVGLSDGALAKTASFGIRGMMERVRALGGWLDINGAPGRGTTVMLSIPRRRPRAGGAPAAKAA
ncbi:MAG TPA: PAS domain S-box protein [Burkholderiales bacterium]|jgi:PAS domain S-box-containing protein